MLYAIGDIHGRLDKLDALLGKLPIEAGDRFVFLGDYVDRGPDSAGVVERLIDFAEAYPCVFLLGNHESMFLDYLGWSGPAYFGADVFIPNGGDATLASYGWNEERPPTPDELRMPPKHRAFFESLRHHHAEGAYVFVHAGLGLRNLTRAGTADYALENARVEELLWDRASIEAEHDLGVTVVYGHTPRADFEVRWNLPYSIGIDTGAVYGGRLTALRLPDERLFQA
jgi:serine/threonine protein phosphatase 1